MQWQVENSNKNWACALTCMSLNFRCAIRSGSMTTCSTVHGAFGPAASSSLQGRAWHQKDHRVWRPLPLQRFSARASMAAERPSRLAANAVTLKMHEWYVLALQHARCFEFLVSSAFRGLQADTTERPAISYKITHRARHPGSRLVRISRTKRSARVPVHS